MDVTQDLTIANACGEITVNCTVHLDHTARLTLNTRDLIVSDDKPDSEDSLAGSGKS